MVGWAGLWARGIICRVWGSARGASLGGGGALGVHEYSTSLDSLAGGSLVDTTAINGRWALETIMELLKLC